MHVFITCAGCQQRLRVEQEVLTTEICCPRCQAVFVAPDIGVPAERLVIPSRTDLPLGPQPAFMDVPAPAQRFIDQKPKLRRPWYLFALALLPGAIPLVTALGAWLGRLDMRLALMVGIGLGVVCAVLCVAVALPRHWPVRLRLTWSLALSVFGILTAGAFVAIGNIMASNETEEVRGAGETDFASREGRFSVAMPGIPVEDSGTEETEVGPLPIHRFVCSTGRKSAHSVAYLELSDEQAERLGSDEMHALGMASLLANTPGTVSSEHNDWLDNYPFKEVRLDLRDGGVSLARIFAARRRVYVVQSQRPGSTGSGEFVFSFRLGTAGVEKVGRATVTIEAARSNEDYDLVVGYLVKTLQEAESKRVPGIGWTRMLRQLATVYTIQGRYAKAEPLYRRALAIYQDEPAAATRDVAATCQELANLLTRRGSYAEAERLLRRSLDLYERLKNPDNANVADALLGLARLHLKQARPADAEPLARRALALREKPPAQAAFRVTQDPLDRRARLVLAETCAALGKDREAVSILRDGFSLDELALRSWKAYKDLLVVSEQESWAQAPPDVALACGMLGRLYTATGQHAEAELLFERAQAIQERMLPGIHPDVAEVLENYAGFLRKTGHAKKADELTARAKDVRAKHAAENPRP